MSVLRILACLAFFALAAQADIIYVDQSANQANDGTSWADAYVDLQDALISASLGDQIWVAVGTYRPGPPAGPRTATFQLANELEIYGGFDATETTLSERAGLFAATILSGDLNSDDGPNFANNAENSFHVVTGSGTDATARLDGFTIRAGNADGLDPDERGAGLYISSGSPVIVNCTFQENSGAVRGAGIYMSASDVRIASCEFIGNRGGSFGGGIVSDTSMVTITDSVFTSNAADHAGGIYSTMGGSIHLRDCAFDGNSSSDEAGALYCFETDSVLIGCSFNNNTSGHNGGAFYNSRADTLMINCTFVGNTATTNGGAFANVDTPSDSTLVNCMFSGNKATTSGGGAIHNSGVTTTLINCVLSNNTALNFNGGGIRANNDTMTLSNCILWDNIDSGGSDESAQFHTGGGTQIVNYNCIQGLTGGLGGVGNIGLDPLFVDSDGEDNVVGTPDDDLRLVTTSPCIDAADNSALPADTFDLDGDGDDLEPLPIDLAGFARFIDNLAIADTGNGIAPIADMGAFESVESICYEGTVNAAGGSIVDVLYLNGTAGGATRSVDTAQGSLVWASIFAPPAGGPGKFVIHADSGVPTSSSVSLLPSNVGTTCFPFLLPAAAPVAVWNNLGKVNLVGSSQYFDTTPIPDPPSAPTIFLQLLSGDAINLPAGTEITFQGIIVDPASLSAKGASTTNAVILRIL